MISGSEYSHATSVPMTPDASVIWNVYDVSQESNLYISPSCPAGVAEAALHYAGADYPNLSRLGRGGNDGGIVYDMDGYALKMTPVYTQVGVAGLSTIRANVALHAGLARIKQVPVPFLSPYSYSAPELYAAIVPKEPAENWEQVVSVMDIATGAEPRAMDAMPSTYKKRHSVYTAALNACGLNPADVFTDDNHRNIKVKPGRVPGTQSVTKFDVVANRQYDW